MELGPAGQVWESGNSENSGLRAHFKPLRIARQLSVLPNSFVSVHIMDILKKFAAHFFDFFLEGPTPLRWRFTSSHYLPNLGLYGARIRWEPEISENPGLRDHFKPLLISRQLSVLPNSFVSVHIMATLKKFAAYFFDFFLEGPTPLRRRFTSSHYLHNLGLYGARTLWTEDFRDSDKKNEKLVPFVNSCFCRARWISAAARSVPNRKRIGILDRKNKNRRKHTTRIFWGKYFSFFKNIFSKKMFFFKNV